MKNKKKHKKSNQIRFEVILGKSKIAWDLPESMLGYVQSILKNILNDYPVPESMEGRKTIDDYLKEMVIEAKKSRELEQDRSLEKIQQQVLNIMGPLSKLWVGVDEIEMIPKFGRMSLEDLSTAIEQAIVSVGWASQSITYERRYNVLISLLRVPRKSTSILKEESDLFVEKSKLQVWIT